MIRKHTILVGLLSLFLVQCSLEVSDPNAGTDEDVLNSREGILTFATGMQGYYAETALPAIIRIPAVSTREFAINTTFANLQELEEGGNAIPDENASILQLWSRLYRVVEMGDLLIENAPNVQLSDEELTEVQVLAHIYKAMALGYVIQNYEQAPITTSIEGDAAFQSRDDVLAEAISLLEEAEALTANLPGTLTVTLPGFDIPNTINALLARYNLFAGNHQAAIDYADAVDLSAQSVFNYDGTSSRNPIYQDVYVSEDYLPQDDFGSTLTEAGDERLDFYLIEEDLESEPNAFESDLLAGFFDAADASIPVYLPGEMYLVRAEAYLGLDQPGLAVDEINEVRTKEASEDAFGVGANLGAYTGATDDASLEEEIYRQRSAELFLSGMRFEDARRLGRPAPQQGFSSERNRNYYPYPQQERINNPNTPENPEI
ncbi:MAG: RagB/SusD family nutrient uptake outer membrane protein [Bacteroidota bacterium]